jgi:hypothetical protein
VKRHELDAVSLVAGLLFLTLGVASLLDLGGAIELRDWWIGPAVLVALGVSGILSVILHARRSSRRDGAAVGNGDTRV